MLINTIQLHLSKRIEAGELSNAELVQLIEHIGMYLNLCSIAAYAKQHGLSYNGAKNYRQHICLFGEKFIIDNQ